MSLSRRPLRTPTASVPIVLIGILIHADTEVNEDNLWMFSKNCQAHHKKVKKLHADEVNLVKALYGIAQDFKNHTEQVARNT